MKFKRLYFYIFTTSIAISGAACTTSAPTNNVNATNANATNTTNKTQTNIAIPIASPAPAATVTAGTPGATVAAYYQAMVKKDEMAFRQTLSKNTLAEFSRDAQAEGAKSLVAYWTGYSSQPKQMYEIRNEKVSGETALLEIKSGETWSWTQLVRENNEWKMDLTEATSEKLLEMTKKK